MAYAVAENLGFTKEQVTWVVVPFNSSYAPGDKNFDFDINQISITPERAQVVDFSDGYYSVQQAVVGDRRHPGGRRRHDRRPQGAQARRAGRHDQPEVHPGHRPADRVRRSVYDDTSAATQALQNGNIDGVVVDLPTAFYITAVELDGGTIVGAFEAGQGGEEFGCCSRRAAPWCRASTTALALLRSQGTLQAITEQWLGGEAGVPTLK